MRIRQITEGVKLLRKYKKIKQIIKRTNGETNMKNTYVTTTKNEKAQKAQVEDKGKCEAAREY